MAINLSAVINVADDEFGTTTVNLSTVNLLKVHLILAVYLVTRNWIYFLTFNFLYQFGKKLVQL